jgi:hypothetical protein
MESREQHNATIGQPIFELWDDGKHYQVYANGLEREFSKDMPLCFNDVHQVHILLRPTRRGLTTVYA